MIEPTTAPAAPPAPRVRTEAFEKRRRSELSTGALVTFTCEEGDKLAAAVARFTFTWSFKARQSRPSQTARS